MKRGECSNCRMDTWLTSKRLEMSNGELTEQAPRKCPVCLLKLGWRERDDRWTHPVYDEMRGVIEV